MKLSTKIKIGFIIALFLGQLGVLLGNQDFYPFVRYKMFSNSIRPYRYSYLKIAFKKQNGSILDEYQMHSDKPFSPYNVRSIEALLSEGEGNSEISRKKLIAVLRARNSKLASMIITHKICSCEKNGLTCRDENVQEYNL